MSLTQLSFFWGVMAAGLFYFGCLLLTPFVKNRFLRCNLYKAQEWACFLAVVFSLAYFVALLARL